MLRVITPATEEPVTLAEAKVHLRVEHNAEDALIQALITAAREMVERQTGCALAVAGYEWTPEGGRTEPLPIWPGEVTSAVGEYPILFTTAPGVAPEGLRLAVLFRVEEMYVNRGGSSDKPLTENPALQTLLFLHRRVLP